MPEVAVTDKVEQGSLVIALAGDLDMLTAPACTARLSDAVADRSTRCALVVVDMRRVDFCGSAGVRMLTRFAETCAEADLRLCVVTGRHSAPRRVLELSGVDTVLPVFDDLNAAIAHFC